VAISERKKQQKLQKKKNKRKLLSRRAHASLISGSKASRYASYPIHECLVPEDSLIENGIGSVLWTRRTPQGELAFSAFVVDPYCLGVKNAFFKVIGEQEYEYEIRPGFLASHRGSAFREMHPTCTRKLIEGAVAYAADLGFQPHRDYRNAKGIFGDVDAQACPTRFVYGRDGKPLYIRGPNETIIQAKHIVKQLERTCGAGNYDYVIALDEDPAI